MSDETQDSMILKMFKLAGVEAPLREHLPRYCALNPEGGVVVSDNVGKLLAGGWAGATYVDLGFALATIEAAVYLTRLERDVRDVEAYARELRTNAIRYQQEAAHFACEAMNRYATRRFKSGVSHQEAEALLSRAQCKAKAAARRASTNLERLVDCLSWLARARTEIA